MVRPPRIRKFEKSKQQQLDELLDKNSAGTISKSELSVLKALVSEAESLMVENAKRLADFAKTQGLQTAGAVPVTIWVQPQVAGR